MSTYLDFRCKTCRENAGLHNHRYGLDDEAFQTILRQRRQVILLLLAAPVLFEEDFRGLPEFFLKHNGHDVVLENGYGQEYLVDQKRWATVSRCEMEEG